MRNTILRLTGALFFAACAPAFASEPASTHYATALTVIGESSPYTGSLVLDASADGTLRGYYFNSDYSLLYSPVVGARSGNTIWLDIESGEVLRIEGRIDRGVIEGGAVGQSTQKIYTFTATPEATQI